MAKIRTQCAVCGGTTDGTPSGKKRHEASNQHRTAAAIARPTMREFWGADQPIAKDGTFRNGKHVPEDKDEVETPEGQAALEAAADAAKVARKRVVVTDPDSGLQRVATNNYPDSPEVAAVRQELKKRLADLKWRQERQIGNPTAKKSTMAGQAWTAEQVEDYRQKKVAPLETRLAELSKG